MQEDSTIRFQTCDMRGAQYYGDFSYPQNLSLSSCGTLIEPKYLPSGHCTARPIIDVPHRDKSTSTPSAMGALASMVPRGVDQRPEHSVMSLIFMRHRKC